MVPSADEALRREAWLKQRRGVGDLLASIGKAFAKADIPLGEAWRALDLFGEEEETKLRVAEEERLRTAMALEAVDRDEAAWAAEKARRPPNARPAGALSAALRSVERLDGRRQSRCFNSKGRGLGGRVYFFA